MHLDQTLDTSIEKVGRVIVYLSKLDFYYVDRKMENVIRSHFTSIEEPHNFIYFRVQRGLKYMLEYLASFSGYFRKYFVGKWRWNIFTKYTYYYYFKIAENVSQLIKLCFVQ